MQTVNIHEAKTKLSKLIARAVEGEDFIIAKAGKPLVKVTRIEGSAAKPKNRLGFMADHVKSGTMKIPDDFDTMGQKDIEDMFGLND